MNIRKLKNGDLEMTAGHGARREIKQMLARPHITMISQESEFIVNFLDGDPMGDGVSYEQVAPEEVGALTGAPLISDGQHIYGYMDYQVRNFLDELVLGNPIVWKKG